MEELIRHAQETGEVEPLANYLYEYGMNYWTGNEWKLPDGHIVSVDFQPAGLEDPNILYAAGYTLI